MLIKYEQIVNKLKKGLQSRAGYAILYTSKERRNENMKRIHIDSIENAPANKGTAREWALAQAFGISRTKHDNGRYDKGSDIELPDGRNISAKFGGFSLMNGSLCEGRTTMEGIWDLYISRVHSNLVAYITETYDVYLMNMDEFKEFIFTFGRRNQKAHRMADGKGGGVSLPLDPGPAIIWKKVVDKFEKIWYT